MFPIPIESSTHVIYGHRDMCIYGKDKIFLCMREYYINLTKRKNIKKKRLVYILYM